MLTRYVAVLRFYAKCLSITLSYAAFFRQRGCKVMELGLLSKTQMMVLLR